MNPIGYTFEIFDDFGRFRTKESIEDPKNLLKKTPDKGVWDNRHIYKILPVDASGAISLTGVKNLDSKVKDAFELIDKIAKSQRARQSIIRHAFRYFIGRNEMLSDSKTLMDAEKAYINSGGSFDAVIISLLTSDSFIYRKSSQEN